MSPASHDQLVREAYAVVRKYVYLAVADNQEAEDVVHETMVEVLKAASRFRGDSKVSTWAITIARRCMFSWIRQLSWRRKYETFGELELFSAEGAGDATAMIAMRTALAQLSEKKRAAFVAMAIYELTAEEAGAALGIPSNTAASRYRAAREELGAMLHEPLVRPAIGGAS